MSQFPGFLQAIQSLTAEDQAVIDQLMKQSGGSLRSEDMQFFISNPRAFVDRAKRMMGATSFEELVRASREGITSGGDTGGGAGGDGQPITADPRPVTGDALLQQQRQQITEGLRGQFDDPRLREWLQGQAAQDLFARRTGRGKNLQTSLEKFGGAFRAFKRNNPLAPDPLPEPVVEPVVQPIVQPDPVTVPTVQPEPIVQPTVQPEPVTVPTVQPEPVLDVQPTDVVTSPMPQPAPPPDIIGDRPQGFSLDELVGQQEQAITDIGIRNLAEQLGRGFDPEAERQARREQIERDTQQSREFMGRAFGLTPTGLQSGKAIRVGGTIEAQRLGELSALESELSQRAGQEYRANLASLQNLRQQNIQKSLSGEQLSLEDRRVTDQEARTNFNETVARAGLTGTLDGQKTVQEMQRKFDNRMRETELFGGMPPQTFQQGEFLSAFSGVRQRGDPQYRAEWDLNQDGVMDLSDRIAMMSRLEDMGNGVWMYSPPGPQTLAARQLGIEERRLTDALSLQRDTLSFDMEKFYDMFERGVFESDRGFSEAQREFNASMEQRKEEFAANLGLSKAQLSAQQSAALDNLIVSSATEIGKMFVNPQTGKFQLPFRSGGRTPGGVSQGGSRISGVVTDSQVFNLQNALRNAGISLAVDQLIGGRASDFGSYAARGAALGSLVPGLGTAGGALIGGAIGAFKGFFGGGGPQEGTRANLPAQETVKMFDFLNNMTKTDGQVRNKVDNFVRSIPDQQFFNLMGILQQGGMNPQQIAQHIYSTALAHEGPLALPPTEYQSRQRDEQDRQRDKNFEPNPYGVT